MTKTDFYQKNKRIFLLVLSAFVCVLVACSSDQAEEQTQSVEVVQAYMPALVPGQTTGAVYMKLINKSEEEKTLNHIETDVAGMTHVHRNFYEDGVMKMRMVHHLKLAPKETLQFEPGGYHVMLMDVSGDLEVGAEFPLILHFDAGEQITAQVTVKARQ